MTLSPEWTLLVLLAASMHAGWNVLVKTGDDALVNMTLIMTMAGLIALAATPFVTFPNPQSWPYLAGSILTHIGYYIFLLLGYRYGDLSLVYPIARGSAPMLVALSAWAIVGEEMSMLPLIGVAAISLGILSLALDRPLKRRHPWRPVAFGLLTSLTIMGYTLCDGQGVRLAGDKWGYIVWLFVLDAPPLIIACLFRRGIGLFAAIGEKWQVAALGGGLSMAAYGIAIYAMSRTGLAQVASLRETSVIFAAIFSALWLKESFSIRRYGAVAMVALGAILLH